MTAPAQASTQTQVPAGDDRLMLAVLIAATVHMLIIFGITFDALRPKPGQHQVEVTLVQQASRRPDEARHIARTNQRGSGNEALRELAAGQEQTPERVMPQSAVPPPEMSASRAERERLNTPAVSSPRGERRINDRRGDERLDDRRADDLPQADRELARLNERLAELEAALNNQRQPQSAQPRVRRLDAVSAKAAVDAAYLAEWRRRVETVGNQYYPQASLRYGIFGKLRMLVTVRSDGSLESVDLLESSGYAVLDEAAIRIVRLAAPYPPFPEDLAKTTDKLEIVRTWQFEQNALSSG